MNEKELIEAVEKDLNPRPIGLSSPGKNKLRRRSRAPYLDGNDKHRWHAICQDVDHELVFKSAETRAGLEEALSDYDATPNILAIYEGRLCTFTEKRQVIL